MKKISLLLTLLITLTMNTVNSQTDFSPLKKLDRKTAKTLADFYHFWETGDGDLLAASTSKSIKDHDRNPTIPGTDYESILGTGKSLHGLSEMQHVFTEVLPQDDGRIVIRWQGSAKHSGEVFGIPATGKTVYFNGHDIIRLEENKIVELWHIEQLLQLLSQIQN